MKYWKNISRGWKRIHIVLSFIFCIIFNIWLEGEGYCIYCRGHYSEIANPFLMLILPLLLYFLIVIIIEWIKEGFKTNEKL